MKERAPYSRVYWSVMDDEKFDGIREDVKLFGSWTLMLILADMAFPAPAFVPKTIQPAAIKRLSDCGLVDLLPGHRYRVRGLDAERRKRSEHASNAADMRWHASSTAETMPSQGKAEAEHSQAEAPRDPADAYWQLTGKYPTDKVLGWVDDLSSKYGAEAVIRALVTAHTADRSTPTLLGRTQDILRSEARELDRREREDEAQRLREKRAVPRTEEPWKAEYRRMLEERYGDAA